MTTWRKSRRCGESGQCAEVATTGVVYGMRDSNDLSQELWFNLESWRQFIEDVRNGKLDHGGA